MAPSSSLLACTIGAVEVEPTIVDTSEAPRLSAALEKTGIEFIAENGGGAGVRLKKRARR
jgi:hypothetical protein